ncbi:MAG: DNA-formamidopyrimidine glycosylase family protein [Dehalococcoidia bacterium]
MPEGDALFRFARKLRPALEGNVIRAARAHGPGPVPQVHRIVGATCTQVRSQGKNMLISFDNGLLLRGHLRMYGTWHLYKPGEPWIKPEREARLVLETDHAVIVNFSAPVIELLEERALAHHQPIAGLGPNLTGDTFDAEQALVRLRDPARANVTIGDAIMDQKAMAGVGNIWKHETLFHCGINPWLLVRELDDATLRALIGKAEELLGASIGRPDARGQEQRRPSMFVYTRRGQPCRRCATRIAFNRQGIDIRYTAWCPKCQPIREGQAVLPPQHPRASSPSR